MWTKARCLAALESRLPDAFAVDVAFRKPILLPGRVEFASRPAGEGIDFAVRDAKKHDHPTPRKRSDQSEHRRPTTTGSPTAAWASACGRSTASPARTCSTGIRIRKQVEKIVYRTTKNGFRTATAAGRTFKAAQQLGKPARQAPGKSTGLFDLTPDDEQQMFQEACRAFAEEKVRPAALEADADCVDAAGAARPGGRARRQHARRPRGARRRHARAGRRSPAS